MKRMLICMYLIQVEVQSYSEGMMATYHLNIGHL